MKPTERNINAVLVQRGNYYFGRTMTNTEGAIVSADPPRWEPDADGGGVAICAYDTETDTPIGEADLFPWWDTQGIDGHIRGILALTRRNFPSPEELYTWAKDHENSFELCDICEGACAGYDCGVCPVHTLKEDRAE